MELFGNFFTVAFCALGGFCALMLYGWMAEKVQKKHPTVAGLMMLPILAFGLSIAPAVCIRFIFGLTIAAYSFPVLFIACLAISAKLLRKQSNQQD